MKEILINVQNTNTKVCIVEDGQLVEFWVERKNIAGLVGNIYKGKVTNVLQGMQAAFVNIGLEKNAFLYAGDTLAYKEELKDVTDNRLNLKAGDKIIVQVVKDQFGSKGARVSMNVTLPGRLVVLMPMLDYVGVSRKIMDEDKRNALIDYVKGVKPQGYGFILRTQAEDCDLEELRREMNELVAKWEEIKRDIPSKKVSSLVYKDEDLAVRAVRDMLRNDVDKVVINNRKMYEEFVRAFPDLYSAKPDLFEIYTGVEDLWERYKITEQIDGLLERRVNLKNGGYLIIDRTEALTVIDVNTGKYVGDKNLEETVFETNRIAAIEIARQLRLRNIGGIVVIDFIDMNNSIHIDKIMQTLQQELAKDRTKTSIAGMSSLGLVELTRKKKRSMIDAVMLQPCPYCRGNGYVFSDEHVAGKLKNSINAYFACKDNKALLVTVAPSVFNKIFTARLLEKECENEWADKRIYMLADPNIHIEKFTIQVLHGSILDLPDNARMLY